MEIAYSARKHGITPDDIECAVRNTIRYIEQEYDGESRIFIIGTDTRGRFLEIVAIPSGRPARIIHADILRPKFYDFLR